MGTNLLHHPVCRFENSRNEIEYIFPITPQLACTVRKSKSVDKEHYFVRTLNKEEVLLYNDQIKNNCSKGYILHQPHLKCILNKSRNIFTIKLSFAYNYINEREFSVQFINYAN